MLAEEEAVLLVSDRGDNESEAKVVQRMQEGNVRGRLQKANQDQKERRARKIEERPMTKALRSSAAKTEK